MTDQTQPAESTPAAETPPDAVTITSVSLHPIQPDGYTTVWIGNNVPQHLMDHYVGRALTPRQLDAVGARLDGDQWVLNYAGRDFLLQSRARDVTHEPVYNEPRPTR